MNQVAKRTENQPADFDLDKLDRNRVDKVAVDKIAGGVAFATALEVMEFAKLMALSKQAVPAVFRNNPGMCLAVCFQAVEWRMSPFQVANKSYVVNDRLGFESQLVHAVIEARANLEEGLRDTYEGEIANGTRKCLVEGTFVGETHPRVYTSPMLKDIKVQNSPLWKSDPDQQLWYYASRAWARKYAPHVLLGIYSKEELKDNPSLGREDDEGQAGPGLHARLSGGTKSDEGHRDGHAESELSQIAGGAAKTIDVQAEESAGNGAQGDEAEQGATTEAETGATAGKAARKGAGKGKKAEEEPKPRDAAEYVIYAEKWAAKEADPEKALARWKDERQMRSDLLVGGKSKMKIAKILSDKHGIEF